jgi:membrane-associated phospholipid phosphatase
VGRHRCLLESSEDALRFWSEKIGSSLLLFGTSACGYLWIDSYNERMAAGSRTLSLATSLDALIPFVPELVFVYVLYYLWVFLPLPILTRREDFYRALGAFALVQIVGGLVFVALPSHIVRPSLAPDGAAFLLLQWMYRLDGSWNVFPSLHVAHAVLVALLFRVHRHRLFAPVALGSVLITASTVLVKQHYLMDIPAGALLAWIGFRALRLDRVPRRRCRGSRRAGC